MHNIPAEFSHIPFSNSFIKPRNRPQKSSHPIKTSLLTIKAFYLLAQQSQLHFATEQSVYEPRVSSRLNNIYKHVVAVWKVLHSNDFQSFQLALLRKWNKSRKEVVGSANNAVSADAPPTRRARVYTKTCRNKNSVPETTTVLPLSILFFIDVRVVGVAVTQVRAKRLRIALENGSILE